MSRKKKQKGKLYESTQKDNDTFARIYDSMLEHPAFVTLSPQQKTLYLYCKAQLFREKKKPIADDSSFTMNRAKYSKYGLYSKNSGKSFQRDIDALIEHGLIDCVQSGKNTRTKSIYRFSDRWQRWGTPYYVLPTNCMTTSLLRKKKDEEKNRIDGNI